MRSTARRKAAAYLALSARVDTCYSWNAMHTKSPSCTCGHTDTLHLQNVGPCTQNKARNFCGCEHYYPFRVYVPVTGRFPALLMKNSGLTPWAHPN